MGRNVGATMERLCESKEFLGLSLNYGLQCGAEVLSIWKVRYLLKGRKVIVTNLNVVAVS